MTPDEKVKPKIDNLAYRRTDRLIADEKVKPKSRNECPHDTLSRIVNHGRGESWTTWRCWDCGTHFTIKGASE